MRYSRRELERHGEAAELQEEERRTLSDRRIVDGRRKTTERRSGSPAIWNRVDLSLAEHREVMKRGDCFEPRSLDDRRRGEDRRSEYPRRHGNEASLH